MSLTKSKKNAYQKEKKNRVAEILDTLGFDVEDLKMNKSWRNRIGIPQRRFTYILRNNGPAMSKLEEAAIRSWLINEVGLPEDTKLWQ